MMKRQPENSSSSGSSGGRSPKRARLTEQGPTWCDRCQKLVPASVVVLHAGRCQPARAAPAPALAPVPARAPPAGAAAAAAAAAAAPRLVPEPSSAPSPRPWAVESHRTAGIVEALGDRLYSDLLGGGGQLLLCEPFDAHGALPVDRGFACGFKNAQNLCSALLRRPGWRERLFGCSGGVPTVAELQRAMDCSRRDGHDSGSAVGAIGGVMSGSRRRVGASDVAPMMTHWGVDVGLVDFRLRERSTSPDALVQWVRDYFRGRRGPGTPAPPLMLQYAGHSFTVVGVSASRNVLLKVDPDVRGGLAALSRRLAAGDAAALGLVTVTEADLLDVPNQEVQLLALRSWQPLSEPARRTRSDANRLAWR